MATKTSRGKKTGQGLLEYVLIFSTVLIALVALQPVFQKRLQAVIKVIADDYSNGTQGNIISKPEMAIRQQIYKKDAYAEGKDFYTSSSYAVSDKAYDQESGGKFTIQPKGYTLTTTKSTSVGGDFRELNPTAYSSDSPPGLVSVDPVTQPATHPAGTQLK
jgi:hypothetical protein